MGCLLSVIKTVTYRGYKATFRWAKWYVSYFCILFRKRHSRMFQYDLTADGQPYKAGFFIPAEEWNLECLSRELENDEMFCFGINSYGECLTVQIARDCACDSSSLLLLKIKGHTYFLPVKSEYLTTNDERTFGSNRFFMQCLAPFRKWKIFFNGVLREILPEKGHKDIHVRFSLIWVASSGVFDFLSDFSFVNMADILSEIKWNSIKPPINRILSNLNEYHQSGMIHGMIEIEGESSQELSLWGCRCHSFGSKEDRFESFSDIIGNTENGFFLCFKFMSAEKYINARNFTGYIMQPNGLLKPVQFLSARRITTEKKTTFSFRIKAGGFYYKVSAFFSGYGNLLDQGLSNKITLTMIDLIVNGIWGSGILIQRLKNKRTIKKNSCHEKCKLILDLIKTPEPSVSPLIVKLEDSSCLNKSLSGNLSFTLAKLMQLKDIIAGYDIPDTVVITTSGYKEFISPVQECVKILKENMFKYDMDELLPLCERIVCEISNSFLPSSLLVSLSDKLNSIFEADEEASFNIYPSVTGNVIEVQLLEAYLSKSFCIKGVSEIAKCLKLCWASQYSLEAILCKRSTGLALSIPMAVIIQKVVSFDTSGIISTCESATGNPSILEIREIIHKVSPHTIRITRLKRDQEQRIRILDCYVLHDNNIDENHKNNENKTNNIKHLYLPDEQNALSSEQLVFLGKLSCKLEAYFHFPLGIEWCLNESKFYIIQVRAITFTNTFPKSEVFHYHDTYIRSEDDWFSSFAFGEAHLGPVSPLGMNFINFSIDALIAKLRCVTPDLWKIQVPYFPKFLMYSHYYIMYNIADICGLLCFHSMFSITSFQIISFIMNFKPQVEEALLEFISFRYGSSNLSLKLLLKNLYIMLRPLNEFKNFEAKVSRYNLEGLNTASSILDILSKNYQDFIEPFICFMKCTHKALMWTMLIFYILKINMKKADNLQKDFNFLMSAYAKPENGDIIFDMLVLCKKLSMEINPDLFHMMPAQDAKVWLEDTETDKKIQFLEFLKKHGYRCSGEVDLFKKCWNMDPICLIRVLQVIVLNPMSSYVPATYPLDSVFSQLSVMPNWFQKIILKYAVPKSFAALKEAKKAKLDLLKIVACWREALHILADKAVEEFRIPFPEAMFFLSLDEIRQILKTEMPHLVTKALKCWEIFTDLEKNVFPVMTIGYPFPLDENYYKEKRLAVGSYLQGCPMSRGTVIGTAVVLKKFCEGLEIKAGSILITRSPSIIWSLYFPVIGGFAADMGGIMSDGAVAARDWGVPCVINLVRASLILRTGDHVFLDSNRGILRRIH